MSVTVIGDAFIDVIVPVGGINPGETHYRKIAMSCGGTANVAVQIAKLGKKAKFVGKVGNDIFGEYFRQNLRVNEVKDLVFVDRKNPTGICISMVYDGGERAMIANRGANDYLKKEDINVYIDEIINSRIIYFSGYSLLSKQSSEAVLYVVKKCRKKNCEIYFNPGAPNIIKDSFKNIVRNLVDVLIMNIDEARTMTRKNKIEDILESLRKFANFVVITLGKNRCIVSKKGEYIQVKTKKLSVLDTTGAGDAFTAEFIVGILRSLDEIDCARLANKVAARFLREKTEILR